MVFPLLCDFACSSYQVFKVEIFTYIDEEMVPLSNVVVTETRGGLLQTKALPKILSFITLLNNCESTRRFFMSL